MKLFSWRQMLVIILATGMVGGVAPARAADGEKRERLFENAYVTVDRITLAPGEGLARHSGPERIVYSLSDYTIAWTEAGDTATKSWRAGDVHAHAALDHEVENAGNTIAEYLVVARTSSALPPAEGEVDAAEIAGGYAAVLADFDSARVLRVSLPPGVRQPLHHGRARLVYVLNDQQLVFLTDGGERREVAHGEGELHWHDAGRHAVENTGETTARFVLFAFE